MFKTSSLTTTFILLCNLLVNVHSRDCYLACDEVQITYDKAPCYRNCDMKVIVGATVGSFCGVLIVICLICCCRYRTNTCMYFVRRKLKKKFNLVDPGRWTLLQFQSQADDLIRALKKSQALNNFYFQFKGKKETMALDPESITSTSEGDFLLNITFKGKDNFSIFYGEGYFLYRDGQPFFWFFIRYDPYDTAVQLGMREIIIFQSLSVGQQAWMGCWYADDNDQPQEERIKGKWTLIMKVIGITNRLQEITLSTQLY